MVRSDVTVDSTKQHGAHVFDVNCQICTAAAVTTSTDDSRPLPFIHSNASASQHVASRPNALSKDGDFSQDVLQNSPSLRKKICLTQRLKMYSTAQQKTSTSDGGSLTDDKCSDDEVQMTENDDKPLVNKPELKANTGESKIVEKLEKDTSVEWKNGNKKKPELHAEPQAHSVTSWHSSTAKQQQVCIKEHQTDARYVAV